MGPDGVVVDAPRLNRGLRIDQGYKSVFVQALIATLAVEALDIGVLDRLAWSNESQRHAARVRPRVERTAAHFGPLSTTMVWGRPTAAARRSRRRATRSPGNEIDLDGDVRAGEVIQDIQRAEVAAIGQRIAREVHRPAFHRTARHRQRDPLRARQAFRRRRRTCTRRRGWPKESAILRAYLTLTDTT